MLGIFEHFVIINAFNATAKSIGYEKPQKRYQEAVEKLGEMCLRYALKMLQNDERQCAKRYLHLAPALKEGIQKDKRYQELWKLVDTDNREEFIIRLQEFEKENVLVRTVSYEPPEGFIEI